MKSFFIKKISTVGVAYTGMRDQNPKPWVVPMVSSIFNIGIGRAVSVKKTTPAASCTQTNK